MKWELHPKQAALSRALYVIRLRHGPFRSGGRWIRRSVADRRDSNEREWASRMKSRPWQPKPWQSEGRQSPREELMQERRSTIRYAFPGWMRFYHGKGMPLVGCPQLYVVRSRYATRDEP